MHLSKDLREFVALLNSKQIDYLVVGAFAVGWHGHMRFTADIDFLVGTRPENSELVVAALKEFGFGSLGITVEDLSRPDQFVQLGAKPNRIDLITSIAAVDFETAWKNRVPGTLDGLPVNYISMDDLIRNKESTGRGKDALDAEELRKRKAKRGHD